MQKILRFYTALFAVYPLLLWANPTTELQARLNLVQNLQATFIQEIQDENHHVIETGTGKLSLKRPNLFRLDSQTPQELHIISDGKTLWYYDPFVQQATAHNVNNVVENTPFILLTTDNSHYWQQYLITQKADTFTLKPKTPNATLKQFTIQINSLGQLQSFSSTENDGQTNSYQLNDLNNRSLKPSQFQFKLPKGVELDDQRQPF